MRPTDNKGEDRDLECKAPENGKFPVSTSRRVELTCLLDMISNTKQLVKLSYN